jgi:hypothetical protein
VSSAGQLLERRVADQVPVRVVDALEVVEVEQQDRHRAVVAQRALHLRRQPLDERPPVEQVRERVGGREHLEPRVVGERQLDDLRALDDGHRGAHRRLASATSSRASDGWSPVRLRRSTPRW